MNRRSKIGIRATFDLAVDNKLRGRDVVKVKIDELLVSGGRVRSRASVIPQKTGRPVQFQRLEFTHGGILAWLERRGGALDAFVFPSRVDYADPIGARQYARLVDEWVAGIGLRPEEYGARPGGSTRGKRKQSASAVRFCARGHSGGQLIESLIRGDA
jgi:hypothetical protein